MAMKTPPYLTVVYVNDGEKDRKLLSDTLRALSDVNRRDVVQHPKVQVIVLNQAEGYAATQGRKAAKDQAFDVEVIDSESPVVDGVRVWDLLSDLRRIRDRIKGRYLFVAHKEWLFYPQTVGRAVRWLQDNGEPVVALANLRRPGLPKDFNPHTSSSEALSRGIRRRIGGNTRVLAKHFTKCPTTHWTWRREWEDVVGSNQWIEDAFFVRMDWLDATKFLEHADRMFFQDVFDLMGTGFKALRARGLAGSVPRMPLETCRLLHLYHKKGYKYLSESVEAWFQDHADRFAGTKFIDRHLYRRCREFIANQTEGFSPIAKLRCDPGGTVDRWTDAFCEWLDNGGARSMSLAMGMDLPEPVRKLRECKLERVAVVCPSNRWKVPDGIFQALRAGADATGARTDVVTPSSDWPITADKQDAFIVWNGLKPRTRSIVANCRARGIGVVVAEHGWFQRGRYVQLDPEGFNHRASWARGLASRAAPTDGPARLRMILGKNPRNTFRRNKGVLLVLGQVILDAQMKDSETARPERLLKRILETCPPGIDIVFRPHPLESWRPVNMGVGVTAGTLDEDIKAARFCVTINSNAGNDAIVRGCPVLSLGPSLYGIGRAAKTTTLDTMEAALADMMDGWAPGPDDVKNYLGHLATRQWSLDEIAEGPPMQAALEAATVNDREQVLERAIA